jgi:hypothetical protein
MNKNKRLVILLASLLMSGAMFSVNAWSNPPAEVMGTVPSYENLSDPHHFCS